MNDPGSEPVLYECESHGHARLYAPALPAATGIPRQSVTMAPPSRHIAGGSTMELLIVLGVIVALVFFVFSIYNGL
ncbi:hypothetical protein, partial [Thioalkalivibrio sp.]|uniref:hypothetical protein n=1 Tax=Thioalkalivibrio sp. TaxID=2093813 RepID=UPI0025FA3F2A